MYKNLHIGTYYFAFYFAYYVISLTCIFKLCIFCVRFLTYCTHLKCTNSLFPGISWFIATFAWFPVPLPSC